MNARINRFQSIASRLLASRPIPTRRDVLDHVGSHETRLVFVSIQLVTQINYNFGLIWTFSEVQSYFYTKFSD